MERRLIALAQWQTLCFSGRWLTIFYADHMILPHSWIVFSSFYLVLPYSFWSFQGNDHFFLNLRLHLTPSTRARTQWASKRAKRATVMRFVMWEIQVRSDNISTRASQRCIFWSFKMHSNRGMTNHRSLLVAPHRSFPDTRANFSTQTIWYCNALE